VRPPVSVAPIGTPVVPIPVRSPIIAGSIIPRAVVIAGIVSGTNKGRPGNTDGNMNFCLRIANREKSSGENNSEHKEEFFHNCIE
jgi:hypothetical protein